MARAKAKTDSDAAQKAASRLGRFEALKRRGEAGDAAAARAVGDGFYRGTEAAEDFFAARTWYLRAAEAGDRQAMNNLVMFYSKGDDARWTRVDYPSPATAPDLTEALTWARAAADLGEKNEATIRFLQKKLKHAAKVAAGQNPP